MITILGVHPAQIEFMEAIERGERVVYHWSMHYLYCFSPDFNPQEEQYLSHWVSPGMHELLYSLYHREKGVVGISFSCLQGLLRDTDLLTTQDKDGNIVANSIYEYGIAWLEEYDPMYRALQGEKKETVLQDNEKGLQFLQKYPILVPYSVWSKAVPTQTS